MSAYLARIGLHTAPPASADGLADLIRAHRLAIPFENLDIRLGRGVQLDPRSVHGKLVSGKRGGYCFEQNGLLAGMLQALGFAQRPLLARVLLGPPGALPARSHTLLLVTIAGQAWLADVGFGGSFVPPLPLIHSAEANTSDGVVHRLLQVGAPGSAAGEWRLERQPSGGGEWQTQYSFDLAETSVEDLEQANHWTATRPGTRFTSFHIVSRALPNGIAALTERMLSITRGSAAESRELTCAQDYRQALSSVFGIELSEAEVEALPLFAQRR